MYKKIMIAIDGSDVTHATVLEGLAVAQTHGAEVLFYFVLPNCQIPIREMTALVAWTPNQHYEAVRQEAEMVLASAVAQAQRIRIKSSSAIGLGLDAAESIAATADERKCDMIVVGSNGRTAIQRLLFGSVVTRLITFATVPVLVCKRTSLKGTMIGKLAWTPKRGLSRRLRARGRATPLHA